MTEPDEALCPEQSDNDKSWVLRLQYWLPVHRAAALAAVALLVVIASLTALVPVGVVAIAAMVLLASVLAHQFTIQVLSVDDEWAQQRARRVAARSFERGNIDGVMQDSGRRPIWHRRRRRNQPNPSKRIAKKS